MAAAAAKPKAGHRHVLVWVLVLVALAGAAWWVHARSQAVSQGVDPTAGLGADLGYLDGLSADQLAGADQGAVAGAGVPVASSPPQPAAGGTVASPNDSPGTTGSGPYITGTSATHDTRAGVGSRVA